MATARAATARSCSPRRCRRTASPRRSASRPGCIAVDHRADLADLPASTRPAATACCAFAERHALGHLVGKDRGARSEGASTSCLPAVSVPMQASAFPAVTSVHQLIASTLEVMVTDHIGLRTQFLKGDGLERQARARPRSARRDSISGWCGSSPITVSKRRCAATARIWKALWCPAPIMPSTFASVARQVPNRHAGRRRRAQRGQQVAAHNARGRPVSASKRNTVDWWLVSPRAALPGQ